MFIGPRSGCMSVQCFKPWPTKPSLMADLRSRESTIKSNFKTSTPVLDLYFADSKEGTYRPQIFLTHSYFLSHPLCSCAPAALNLFFSPNHPEKLHPLSPTFQTSCISLLPLCSRFCAAEYKGLVCQAVPFLEDREQAQPDTY